MKTLLALLILCLACPAHLVAQSPNPFGIPSADIPNPAARIAAAPGFRAQGWLGLGRFEILARNGVVATSDSLASEAGPCLWMVSTSIATTEHRDPCASKRRIKVSLRTWLPDGR